MLLLGVCSQQGDAAASRAVADIGVDVVRGHGRLDGRRRVAVATPQDRIVLLTARHAVVICTGSRAALPDMPGIAEARAWTNRTATDTSTVPARLAVVGGGCSTSYEALTCGKSVGPADTNPVSTTPT
jgi:pyruvate/2-oxoglutarate dehydrogenase complex dihydrolipoamide dehydrogenase (E3) component